MGTYRTRADRIEQVDSRFLTTEEEEFEKKLTRRVRGKDLWWAEVDRLLKDPETFFEFCERFLKIVPVQGGQLINFVPNKIQRWYYNNKILPRELAGQPIQEMILKSRQSGMSTMLEAYCLRKTLANEAWNTMLVARDSGQTKLLFEITQRYLRNLPEGKELPYYHRPRENIEFIEFARPINRKYHAKLLDQVKTGKVAFLDSHLRLMSGEDRDELGRAGTFQTIHCSEVAFWPDLMTSISALTASCHGQPGAGIFLETTANGYNQFQALWADRQTLVEGVPLYWSATFIPWYWDDKYEVKKEDIQRQHLQPTFADMPGIENNAEYERGLLATIIGDTTLEVVSIERAWAKLFWRRRQLAARKYDVDTFNQEYPSTEAEAFISTGRCVFSKVGLMRTERDVCDPKEVGHLTLQNGIAHFEPFTYGRCKIWQRPEGHDQYVVCGDVAEGKATEGGGDDRSKRDFSVAHVLRVTPYPPIEQVAVWHGNCDPDQFATVMYALALWYNRAYLTWEVNAVGNGLIYIICQKYKYTARVHRRQSYENGMPTNKWAVGWYTDRYTKPRMVTVAREMVRDGLLVVRDASTLSEMKAYSELGEARYGPRSGHDDRVTALMTGLASAYPHLALFTARKESMEKKQKKQAAEKSLGRRTPHKFDPVLGSEF